MVKAKEFTKLHEACYKGDIEEVKRILEEGKTSVNVCTERNETPLHFAMCYGHDNLLRLLIEKGAKISKTTYSDITPLGMAVMNGHANAIRKFFTICKEKGLPLDVNQANLRGLTSLHYAASNYLPECVTALLEIGADVNAKNVYGATPLAAAKEEPEEHHHHHEHGESCNHAHHDEKARQKCIQILEKKGGKVFEELPPPAQPQSKLPTCVVKAALHEQEQLIAENKYGGAKWTPENIEVFYTGKKAKVGYAVAVITILNKEKIASKKPATIMRGFISEVSSPTQFKATVKLADSEKESVPELDGEWEVTFQLYAYSSHYPWIVTEMTPLTATTTKSYDVLYQQTKLREQQEGRKIAKKEVEPCIVLQGEEHHHHGHHGHHHEEEEEDEHKTCVKFSLVDADQLLVLEFEDKSTKKYQGEEALEMFQIFMNRNLRTASKGKEGAKVVMNGKEIIMKEYLTHLLKEREKEQRELKKLMKK